MSINRLWVTVCVLVVAMSAHSEIYKWIDPQGKVHFLAAKPDNAVSERLHKIETQAPPAVIDSADKIAYAPNQQVELFITSWCPYCKKAKAYLSSKNIAFKEYDIELDSAAAVRKKALDPKFSGIPLAVINGVLIQGFDEASYEAALAK